MRQRRSPCVDWGPSRVVFRPAFPGAGASARAALPSPVSLNHVRSSSSLSLHRASVAGTHASRSASTHSGPSPGPQRCTRPRSAARGKPSVNAAAVPSRSVVHPGKCCRSSVHLRRAGGRVGCASRRLPGLAQLAPWAGEVLAMQGGPTSPRRPWGLQSALHPSSWHLEVVISCGKGRLCRRMPLSGLRAGVSAQAATCPSWEPLPSLPPKTNEPSSTRQARHLESSSGGGMYTVCSKNLRKAVPSFRTARSGWEVVPTTSTPSAGRSRPICSSGQE